MKRWLLIDDNKRWEDVLRVDTFFGEKLATSYPDVEFHIARSFAEGMRSLRDGNWDAVYIDWDLGEGSSRTGYQLLDGLENGAAPMPKDIIPCSAHSGHYMEMYKRMQKLLGKPC